MAQRSQRPGRPPAGKPDRQGRGTTGRRPARRDVRAEEGPERGPGPGAGRGAGSRKKEGPAAFRDAWESSEGQAGKRKPGKRQDGKRAPGPSIPPGKRPVAPRKPQGASGPVKSVSQEGAMRLNQYIAHAGVCSRREADKLIPTGVVKVNGKVVTELGFKVMPGDKVQLEDQTLRAEKKQYVVLNKPKGYITTTDDPQERQTVLDLVKDACRERIYPVGRLDRNTTGVLLLTNDGEMATRLTHPRHRVKKVYHVNLDKNLTKADLKAIAEGITLDDGPVRVDAIAWVGDGEDHKEVGVELHSGRNRIVRRIFEHLGYDVIKLDRVMFAGITKKDVPRGKWRHLTQAEVNILKRI